MLEVFIKLKYVVKFYIIPKNEIIQGQYDKSTINIISFLHILYSYSSSWRHVDLMGQAISSDDAEENHKLHYIQYNVTRCC